MHIFTGRSYLADAKKAVREATADWTDENIELDLVLVFSSTKQSHRDVARYAQERFPNTLVVGCTTSGEHFEGEQINRSLVMAGLSTPTIKWSSTIVRNIQERDRQAVFDLTNDLFDRAEIDRDVFDASQYFCLMFVDGLQMIEEWVSETLAEALDGITLVGGSAGDDMQFRSTRVYHQGKAYEDAALLLMGHSPTKNFSVFKHQHFSSTPNRLIVTKCNPEKRRIYEFNGFPAIEAYARALDVDPANIPKDISFLKPLTVSIGNEPYVRSAGDFCYEDGSIGFHCAVEEGMVMHFSDHHEMSSALRLDLEKLLPGPGIKRDFLLSFNCSLRRLESNMYNMNDDIKSVINDIANHSIGFDTYGEQFNGIHINQTVVGIAIG